MLAMKFIYVIVLLFCSSSLLCVSNLIISSSAQNVQTHSTEVVEYCTATPAANLPDIAQCRPASDVGVQYDVEVTPIVGRGLTLQSDVQLVVVGKTGQTQPITISSTDEGLIRRQTISSPDIGSPEQVRLTLASSTEKRWRCQKIVVRQAFRWWGFDCTGPVDKGNPTATYTISGNKLYTITVKTGSDPLAATHGVIDLNIKGKIRSTGFKYLTVSFAAGSQKVLTYRGADVGKIEAIELKNAASDDAWYCITVDVRAEDGQVAHFNVRRWIGAPYESVVEISLQAQHLIDAPAKDIECFTRASDIISGFPDKLEIAKVRCPMNCDNNAFALVRGSSVHPSTSSICQSAVLDGVLGSSGGEIVITTIGGLPEYYEPPEVLTKVVARDYEPSPDKPTFTYFLYQTYSIDNIIKDVRVVDAYGKLAAVGRLEVRRKGDWGAVCSKGDVGNFNQAAARHACQELGFIHGVYLEDGCGDVKGANVCAGRGYKTVVAAVQCTGEEKSFLDCTFEEPPAICSDHVFDVAVQCTNFPPDRTPPAGAVRIVDTNGAPSTLGVGRLEYFLDGWGSVCDDGFTPESEGVACREMGYTAVRAGGASRKECRDVDGVNYCGPPSQKINAVNVACDGTEANLRNCPLETRSDIYCAHAEDIVISCDGDGDPSGVGLFRKEEAPEIGLRPFPPKVTLSCSDRAQSVPHLQGGPGALFIVRCPEGCSEDPTEVHGTFIYTTDSSVCKAAIHAGAIDDSGGEFVTVLGYGQRSYVGTTRGAVTSAGFGAFSHSFMVSLLTPSVGARVAPESQRGAYTHFLGESHLISKEPESFLQASPAITDPVVEPVFSWCPSVGFEGFHGRPQDFVDVSHFPGGQALSVSSDFSLSVKARVTGGSGSWRTILAHTECQGFTLAISPQDELIFEQICNPKTVHSGYKPPINEWLHIVVTYSQSDSLVAIFVNGRQLVREPSGYLFSFRSPLTIGRSSNLNKEFFEGDIACVRIFSYPLNPTQLEAEKGLIETPAMACPLSVQKGNNALATRYTIDNRLCLTPCTAKPPEVPFLPKPEIRKRVTRPAFNIQCDTILSEEQFDGSTGDVFRVICPPGCCADTTPIYGSRIYAPHSSICRAALHQGVMTEAGGEVAVTLQNGLEFYEACTGENYVESELEDTPQIRSFSVSRPQPLHMMQCKSDASFIMKLPLASRELLRCPEGCLRSYNASEKVYGTELYSPASSVCLAAVHAGLLTDAGGQVELSVAGDGSFQGSHQNGIQSSSSPYYLRSFTFLQSTQLLCRPFSFSLSTAGATRRSYWKSHRSPYSDEDVKGFEIDTIPDPNGDTNAATPQLIPAVTVRNIHSCVDDTMPELFIFRTFRCDNFVLNVEMVLTNVTDAGLAIRFQNVHNYFLLAAKVENGQSGEGVWGLTKIVDDVPYSAARPIPYRFKFGTPLHIQVENRGPLLKVWVSQSEKKISSGLDAASSPAIERQMIVNIKDASTEKKQFFNGDATASAEAKHSPVPASESFSVGLQACSAPLTGVYFTVFDITPLPSVESVSHEDITETPSGRRTYMVRRVRQHFY